MFVNNTFNNSSFINSLKVEESNYLNAGTASAETREFKIGYFDRLWNGQKVIQLHQRKQILNKVFPLYIKYEFEGDIPNATIIGWRINCSRTAMDDCGGSWKRGCKVIGTDHFKFIVESCFMRNLDWEITIYYVIDN